MELLICGQATEGRLEMLDNKAITYEKGIMGVVGVAATGVEMSRVHELQNSNKVQTFSLQRQTSALEFTSDFHPSPPPPSTRLLPHLSHTWMPSSAELEP